MSAARVNAAARRAALLFLQDWLTGGRARAPQRTRRTATMAQWRDTAALVLVRGWSGRPLCSLGCTATEWTWGIGSTSNYKTSPLRPGLNAPAPRTFRWTTITRMARWRAKGDWFSAMAVVATALACSTTD